MTRNSPSNKKASAEEQEPTVFEIADGDIQIWTTPGGSICLTTHSALEDPVELSGRMALSLANLLIQVVHDLPESIDCPRR